MWTPPATLMVPSGFTVPEWQALQLAGPWSPGNGGWPVGGIAWHEAQVMSAESLQPTVAWEPSTPRKVKVPWHMTLLQVFVAGSKEAPAAWSIGCCEKSTAKPDGAWQAAQVIPAENAPPRRCVEWSAPAGVGPEDDELDVPAPHPEPTTMLETIRKERRPVVRMAQQGSRLFVVQKGLHQHFSSTSRRSKWICKYSNLICNYMCVPVGTGRGPTSVAANSEEASSALKGHTVRGLPAPAGYHLSALWFLPWQFTVQVPCVPGAHPLSPQLYPAWAPMSTTSFWWKAETATVLV